MRSDEVRGTALRQGDVCEVDFFPLWAVSRDPYVVAGGAYKGIQVGEFSQVARSSVTQGKRLAIVCSYDCDLENPRARKGILIAPLVPVPNSHRDFNEITASSEPRIAEDGHPVFSFVNYYPLDLGEILPGESSFAAAEFSAITTVASPKDASEMLEAGKIFEMTDAQRVSFRTKLAVFVGRAELVA